VIFMENERLLVVAAHTADWLWRCSGTIVKYLKGGATVYVVCLTYGARGESAELWKAEGRTTEEVKRIRYEESVAAAKRLGVTNFEIWDFNDCPLTINDDILEKLNEKIREVQPTVIITHDPNDDTNADHAVASEIVLQAALMSRQKGIESNGLEPANQTQIYGFEPSQTERSGYVPTVYMDVTNEWEDKVAAMACITAQPNTPVVHTRIGTHRGWQAARMPGGKGIKYAESFSVRFPIILRDKLL
jgi:4-oxalomesaconate hydratase